MMQEGQEEGTGIPRFQVGHLIIPKIEFQEDNGRTSISGSLMV